MVATDLWKRFWWNNTLACSLNHDADGLGAESLPYSESLVRLEFVGASAAVAAQRGVSGAEIGKCRRPYLVHCGSCSCLLCFPLFFFRYVRIACPDAHDVMRRLKLMNTSGVCLMVLFVLRSGLDE